MPGLCGKRRPVSGWALTEQHPDWNDEILCEKLTDAGCLLLNYADHIRICKWLRHFQDFNFQALG